MDLFAQLDLIKPEPLTPIQKAMNRNYTVVDITKNAVELAADIEVDERIDFHHSLKLNLGSEQWFQEAFDIIERQLVVFGQPNDIGMTYEETKDMTLGEFACYVVDLVERKKEEINRVDLEEYIEED